MFDYDQSNGYISSIKSRFFWMESEDFINELQASLSDQSKVPSGDTFWAYKSGQENVDQYNYYSYFTFRF